LFLLTLAVAVAKGQFVLKCSTSSSSSSCSCCCCICCCYYTDVVVDAKPVCRDYEPHPCSCQPPTETDEPGCTDMCLNRLGHSYCTGRNFTFYSVLL